MEEKPEAEGEVFSEQKIYVLGSEGGNKCLSLRGHCGVVFAGETSIKV